MAASKVDYEAVSQEESQKTDEERGGGEDQEECTVNEGEVEDGFWGHGRQVMSDFWESVGKQLKRGWGASTTVPLFLVLLFITAFFFIRWSDVVSFLS